MRVLLAPAAGLARLDLVDLDMADKGLVAALIGMTAIALHLPRV